MENSEFYKSQEIWQLLEVYYMVSPAYCSWGTPIYPLQPTFAHMVQAQKCQDERGVPSQPILRPHYWACLMIDNGKHPWSGSSNCISKFGSCEREQMSRAHSEASLPVYSGDVVQVYSWSLQIKTTCSFERQVLTSLRYWTQYKCHWIKFSGVYYSCNQTRLPTGPLLAIKSIHKISIPHIYQWDYLHTSVASILSKVLKVLKKYHFSIPFNLPWYIQWRMQPFL